MSIRPSSYGPLVSIKRKHVVYVKMPKTDKELFEVMGNYDKAYLKWLESWYKEQMSPDEYNDFWYDLNWSGTPMDKEDK
jgi:hypothetical protein